MGEFDDIEQLDKDILIWDGAFATAVVALNQLLLIDLNALLDRLTLRGRATTTEEWMGNMRQVTVYQAGISDTVYRLGFQDLLNGLIIHMGQSADRLNGYYGKMLTGFDPRPFEGVLANLASQTRTLLAGTLDSTYTKVIGDTLSLGVLTKSTTAELRATLTARLLDEGLSVKPVASVASDALYTFSRGYAQAVAEGLNLRHYYYMGTQVSQTRDFCHQRLGKAFTQNEVEGWALLTWAGKIPGTTKQTIFWYCGGYRCRHRLLPISKNTYSILNNNN